MDLRHLYKLNIGSGVRPLPGYDNIDISNGKQAYPLMLGRDGPDMDFIFGRVEEIRASHILEHFEHSKVEEVLKHWFDALKPGGTIKIAVPDFAWIAAKYLDGEDIPTQGYLMGGQVDENDFHKTIFDENALRQLLELTGFTDIKEWESEIDDCASLPVSLNLQGTKPIALVMPKIGAVMSTPRLGFMDNFFCAYTALAPLKITLRKFTGAFWGQCLERAMEESIRDGKEWVLAIDYDTIFTKQNVIDLIDSVNKSPDIDALAALQVHRTKHSPLMTMKDGAGDSLSKVPLETFDPHITKISTAHFGLTLIKVSKLKDMPKPWFWSKPGNNGWDDERQDDDIYFWRQWEYYGNSLFLANRVPVGHAELMIRWPDKEFNAIHQHPSEFYADGKPTETWE